MQSIHSLGLLLILFFSPSVFAKTITLTNANSHTIVVNQLGYLPYIKKEALLLSKGDNKPTGQWQLIDALSQTIVAEKTLPTAQADQHTPYNVQAIDFSYITQSGRYFLKVGDTKSVTFDIGKNVYQPLIRDLLRSYYLQRCGQAIDDSITKMKRKACHLNDGIISHDDSHHKKGDKIIGAGGWHDAGDYGKYIAPAAIVVLELLSRYERYTDTLSKLDLTIPESNNQMPDLLDEMKIALDWMLTMQRDDGAVYRKLSGKHWPHEVAPEQDKQQRFAYGISSQETGKAIAAWALAARLYKPYDVEIAEKYQQAAVHAWQWLAKQKEVILDEHKDDNSGSGPYVLNKIDQEESLKTHKDDQFAAAMELYLSEIDTELDHYLAKTEPALKMQIMEWKNPSSQAMLTALWHPQAQDTLYKTRASLRMKLLKRAEKAYQRTQNSAFGLANHRFVWGSNKMAAQEGIFLKQAAHYFNNSNYENAAWDQFHYLLGRNAHNQTFVTGSGTNPVKKVNHIYSRTTGLYIPGLHVGGPNSKAQAGLAPKGLGPLSYIDADHSYATNEYAIDYNSGLLALLFDLLYLEAKE